MRRLLAICLLMLLPLQFSWAAVAAYCAHESSPQAQHLGHHDHTDAHAHAAAPVDADDGVADSSQNIVDADGCHSHGCCVALTGTSLAVFGELPAATLRPVAGAATGALVPNPPDRPQWARLA